MRTSTTRSALKAAVFVVAQSCARSHAQPDRMARTPLPAYSYDSLVASACGDGHATVPVEALTTVDVLLDSPVAEGIGELPVSLTPMHSAGPGTAPAMAATLVYPVEGRPFPRESRKLCSVAQGIIVRLNAAVLRKAALIVEANGPVRVTVRTVDGLPLASVLIHGPDAGAQTLTWRNVKRAAE
jgi:hypothetical protein